MSDHVDVPEEAVEAGALALFVGGPDEWSRLRELRREACRDKVRLVLNAAAPFIAAKAVEDYNSEHTRLVKRGNEQEVRAEKAEQDIRQLDVVRFEAESREEELHVRLLVAEKKAEHERDKAIEQVRERLLSDEAIQRGERVLDEDRTGEGCSEGRTDYALVKRIVGAILDSREGDSA